MILMKTLLRICTVAKIAKMESSSDGSYNNIQYNKELETIFSVLSIALSILILALAERLVHAFFSTIWHIIFGFDKEADEAKYTVAAIQLCSSFISILNRIIFSMINIILQSLTGIVSWSLILFVLLFATGLVYIAYEQYPLLARGFGLQWNFYVGPQIHAVVIVPLELGTRLLQIFLPIYNTFAWIFTGIFTSSLLSPILKAPDKIFQCLTATGWFAKTMVSSLTVYSSNTFQSCTAESVDCVSNIGLRTLDLITPMSHIRQIVAILIGWVAADVCRPIGAVADAIAYPLTDINFAKSVHNLVNSLLWAVLQVPIITTARCKLYSSSDQLGTIMCIPDFEPSLQFFMEALRNLGQTIDNWLDICLLVVENTLFRSSSQTIPVCQASPLSALRTDTESAVQELLFGSNFTTVVGLTETLYAMTDGNSIIYYSTAKLAQQSEISQDAWPFAVDPRIGIAAVKYAGSDGTGTTAMMGCRCDDLATTTGSMMSINCAIVEYGKLTPSSDAGKNKFINNHTMPVLFQVDTTRNYMKCGQTKISLESIRWPRKRFTSQITPTSQLLSMLKGIPSEKMMYDADAALWVQPFCGADDRPSEVCLNTFTKAACFPYCMALRQSGSYNSVLRLYNAPDWLDRVHIFNRDCAGIIPSALNVPTSNTIQMASTGYTFLDMAIQAANKIGAGDIVTALSNDWSGAAVHYTSSAGINCINNPLVTSIVPKAMLLESNGDYGNQFFGSTLASGQPFIYAGDTILTANCDSINPDDPRQTPNCTVSVHRIYNSEDNHYTLVETNAKLPAMGVSSTPEGAQYLYESNVLRIPYSYTTNPWTHNPATASENAIFYAVNPYWQVFSAFIQYCSNPEKEGILQLSVTSSFANITVYRVYAYNYCPPTQNQQACFEGLTAGVKIPSSTRPTFNAQECYEPMDIAVSSLEYLDVENVAVNIVRARLADLDAFTLKPKNFTTVTYFLNTITMQIRRDRAWQTEITQPVVTQGLLCPSLRRMPQLGSLLTETGVAGVLFLRMPLNVLLNGIYIFQQWGKREKTCPLVTKGHSAVMNACGSNAFSLKEFFASMDKVNDIFFNIIALAARSLNNFPASGNLRVFLNGIKLFGRHQTDPLMNVVTGSRLLGNALGAGAPLQQDALNVVTTTLQMPSYVTAFKLTVSHMNMANFVWHFVVELIYRIVRAVKIGEPADNVFFATMYDFKKDMDEIVTGSLMKSCAGLSLTFGKSKYFYFSTILHEN